MYDAIIIGAGVTGAAQAWLLALHTDAKRILVIERREKPGEVNSNVTNNSQTLHRGEIETNYDLERALRVKWGSDLLEGFCRRHLPDGSMVIQKQVIAVDGETDRLKLRFDEFRKHFSDIRLLGPDDITKVEPMVMEGRDPQQDIVSLYTPHGRAVDYHQLACKFIELAQEASGNGVTVDVLYNLEVERIEPSRDGFVVRTADGVAHTGRYVSVCAGSGSLLHAHALGYHKEYALLPVAGSFYRSVRSGGLLEGKVYTMQLPKLPFAAVHGDPAVYNPDETRFGPTARPLPMLERHNYATIWEFLRVGLVSPRGILALMKILADWDISKFALENMLYEWPYVGKRAFLRRARKVIPSLRPEDIILDKGAGGVRGQPVNLVSGELRKDADRVIATDAPIAFTLAPSPGASFCLGNAVEIVRDMQDKIGLQFREGNMETMLLSSQRAS